MKKGNSRDFSLTWLCAMVYFCTIASIISEIGQIEALFSLSAAPVPSPNVKTKVDP